MIPKPSHPNSIVIMLGEIIRKIIDVMNIITRCENRWRCVSPSIYILENNKTLNEMNITVNMKMVLAGSKRIGNEM